MTMYAQPNTVMANPFIRPSQTAYTVKLFPPTGTGMNLVY